MTAFIDTNLLIYAHESGAKSETARQVILTGGVISVQVLNEFAAVLRRKFRLEWAVIADALADVRAALGPVRPSTSRFTCTPWLSPVRTASVSTTRSSWRRRSLPVATRS